MLFNSYQFAAFFVAIVFLYFACPFRYRWLLLLIGSYLFYMGWKWQYAFLIAGQTLVNFYAAWAMGRTESILRRRIYLCLGLGASLGLLFFFKYYGFANHSLGALSGLFGFSFQFPALDLILPVGISFFTFQTLSYTIDVYRKKTEVEHHLGRFALYVSFFPQLVAGPIERAQNLLGQFKRENHVDFDRISAGVKLMLWGLFKKVVIADRLATFVNLIYADPSAHSGATLLLATYFFAVQIYCDFSGYSDIAIGAARVLGYDLMQNFRLPYMAQGISDFWSRWHISLSTWFRDYVYIPLGGNRVPAWRWIFNVFVVFTVSGLWHGANWTFVIWGALHGLYYLIESLFAPVGKRIKAAIGTQAAAVLSIIVTFHLVLLSWVFFRAASVGDALLILSKIVTDIGGGLYLGPSQLTIYISLCLIAMLWSVQIMQERGKVSLYFSKAPWPVYARWFCYGCLIVGISILGVGGNEFIYFQF